MDPTRLRDGLLVALTVSSGAVDAICWLALGKVFSAFMTGNLVFLGLRAGGAPGQSVARVLAAVAGFAAGAAVAARIVAPAMNSGRAWTRRVTAALATALVPQAAFLALWAAVGGHPGGDTGHILIAMSALAMGIQTTAGFSLGVRGLLSTASTATVAVLMGNGSAWKESKAERLRLAAAILGLLGGAAIGAVLVINARPVAPLFPLAVTSLVVAAATLAFAQPRAGRHAAPPASHPRIGTRIIRPR